MAAIIFVRRFTVNVIAAWLMISAPSRASDYGTTGLIDIPTARFKEDGVFTVGASTDERHKQFTLTYQLTPWLEGTFRYTGLNDYFFWDRNYEVKARLWAESDSLPQVAVGIRDLVGTGKFGSEYLVASKSIAGTDFSLGIGWGRLAGDGVISNPLARINNRFAVRSAEQGEGGRISYRDFFSGPNVGVFGGISHRFVKLPLTAMIEFNPDRYDTDFSAGVSRPKSPWSVGLTWQATQNTDINLSLQHGDQFGIGFRSWLSSSKDPLRREPEKFVSSLYLPSSQLPRQIDKSRWYDRLLYDVEKSGLLLLEGSISEDKTQAQLVVGNPTYGLWSDAIAAHTALADLHLPASVNKIYFVVEEAGHRSVTVVVPRPSASHYSRDQFAPKSIRILSGRTLKIPQNRTSFVTGKINTTLNVRSRFQLFDPDDPARYQFFVDLASEYSLGTHWAVRSSIAVNIHHNFDESNRQESDSVLPKVRSDVVKYLNKGASGLDKLVIEGRDTKGRFLHYRVFGGYLETMFAGVGGEVLYWPSKSRVAVGMSLAYARQRDFDRRLGLQKFDVLTGHLSAYWATPFFNYDVAIHAGQYLARDLGATFEVRRTFRNGWQIGGWATLTDVPFDDFGEGSFDKGLFFKIPLDEAFNSKSRSQFSTRMRPIQRDGGQRLEGFSADIFWDLRSARYDAFSTDERLIP